VSTKITILTEFLTYIIDELSEIKINQHLCYAKRITT